jgi:hypothetical protein
MMKDINLIFAILPCLVIRLVVGLIISCIFRLIISLIIGLIFRRVCRRIFFLCIFQVRKISIAQDFSGIKSLDCI